MSKKVVSILLVILILSLSLVSCSGGKAKSDKIEIVTTMFPEYDWVMQILGERAEDFEVTMLLGNGVDLHSYQPTVDDIVTISACDLLVYVGGESDSWMKDALKNATNKDMKVVNIIETLGDDLLCATDGHSHTEDEDEHEHDHDHLYDEHVWLSLKNAKKTCEVITDKLCEIDSEHQEEYRKNLADYTAELDKLDGEYVAAVAAANTRTLLFGDRFPFRYLTEHYGLAYYAAFEGCSAETEASTEMVTSLAAKIDELGLKYVIIIDGSDSDIASTIISASTAKDAQILSLDSMQSKTQSDVDNGVDYLTVMRNNLETLKKAIS